MNFREQFQSAPRARRRLETRTTDAVLVDNAKRSLQCECSPEASQVECQGGAAARARHAHSGRRELHDHGNGGRVGLFGRQGTVLNFTAKNLHLRKDESPELSAKKRGTSEKTAASSVSVPSKRAKLPPVAIMTKPINFGKVNGIKLNGKMIVGTPLQSFKVKVNKTPDSL